MIKPSAFTCVTNSSPTHTEIDHPRPRPLGDDDVVEHDVPGEGGGATQRRRSEHQAFFDVRVTRERGLERRIDLGQGDLGEKAEAAEVDAEDRNAGLRLADAIRHPEERAVAAQDEHHVHLVDQRALVGDGVMRRCDEGGRRRFEHGRHAARLEPRGDLTEIRRRLVQV
jgi:hypothetical protein